MDVFTLKASLQQLLQQLLQEKVLQEKVSSDLINKATTTVALVVLCGVLAQLILQIVSQFAPSLPSTPSSSLTHSNAQPALYDIRQLKAANFFGPVAEEKQQTVVHKKSSLNIRVKGLIFSETSQKAMAFLSLNGKNGVYRIGDEINGNSNIVLESVNRNEVIIRHQGQSQSVSYRRKNIQISGLTKQPASTSAGSDKTRQQLKALRVSLKSNPSLLGNYFDIQPYEKNGEVKGFRVNPGHDAALFKGLGLESNDVLLSINKLPLSDRNNWTQLGGLLAGADSLNLELERSGKVVHKTIVF